MRKRGGDSQRVRKGGGVRKSAKSGNFGLPEFSGDAASHRVDEALRHTTRRRKRGGKKKVRAHA